MMVRIIAIFLVILILVVLFVGGAQPQAIGLVPTPWDKLAHMVPYCLFTLLLTRFASLPVVWVIWLALLIGAADELHQSFLPGRVGDWDDWFADAIGAGLGAIRFRRRRREIKPKERT